MISKTQSISNLCQSDILTQIASQSNRRAKINFIEVDYSNKILTAKEMRDASDQCLNRCKSMYNRFGDVKETILIKAKNCYLAIICRVYSKSIRVNKNQSKRECKQELKKFIFKNDKFSYVFLMLIRKKFQELNLNTVN